MSEVQYEPIIGLEIHVELATNSKMFCGCSANWFGKEPNTVCCPVCLGLPGALPVPNKKAVEWCVILGMALGCEIPEFSKFDRKNYFYPDLPKGYQISQYDKPLAVNGQLKIKNQKSNLKNTDQNSKMNEEERIIRIRRVHMEEDTGKLLHETVNGPTSPSGLRGASEKVTLIDFNRSGVPLVEIVTEPDIRGSEEARVFLKKLHQIIRYLGISDADMEKGSMRLEPNISVREIRESRKSEIRNKESELPKYKVEVKNINSFAFAKKAMDYEIKRHIELLERGEIPKQETRGWDEKKGVTVSQRSKEEAHDYRYFPEPDIPPVRWTGDQISKIKNQIPELPDQKKIRFMDNYQLNEYDSTILAETQERAKYFEETVKATLDSGNQRIKVDQVSPKTIANWIINKKIDVGKTSPEELVKTIQQKQRAVQMDEKELEKTIAKVIAIHEKAVSDFKSGKQESLMFLVGQVMREAKGRADATAVRKLLEKALK